MRALAISLLALFALFAGTAQARRAPSAAELQGLAAASQRPANCIKAYVSTVNTHWAALTVRNLRKGCRKFQADGVAVFRYKGGTWHFVTAGSSFDCPVPKVPPKVVKDLKIDCFTP